VSTVAAVLIGGPPATGKSTLAMALAPRLDAGLTRFSRPPVR
jgi:MoxR-like ATPase